MFIKATHTFAEYPQMDMSPPAPDLAGAQGVKASGAVVHQTCIPPCYFARLGRCILAHLHPLFSRLWSPTTNS